MVSFLRTPPGTALASLACAAASVIVVASYAPRQAPLAAPFVLVVLAAVFCLAAAWRGWSLVAGNIARPTLVAAAVAVAFLELVFAYDGTRGAPLTLLTAALVLVALDLPLLISTYGATV
jgi:TRAP-type C4-dicarboxylate transport system permease small subunit